MDKPKTFCFDIDGVIAELTPDNQYDRANPLHHNIVKINFLFDQGHHIILFTARGSATGINWVEVTQQQMADWGVRFHELHFGKPAADYYIDDRMMSFEQLEEFVALRGYHDSV